MDAERYRIPIEELLATLPDDPDDFEVWPENESSLTMFLSCATQWDMHQSGRVQRMNYPALYSVMLMNGTTDMPTTFRDMQIMERAALEEFAKGA